MEVMVVDLGWSHIFNDLVHARVDWWHMCRHLIIWFSGIFLGMMLCKIITCHHIFQCRFDHELPKKYMIKGGEGKNRWLAFNAKTPWEVLEAYCVFLLWKYAGRGLPLEKLSIKRLKIISWIWISCFTILTLVGTYYAIYYTIELTINLSHIPNK